MYPMAFGNSQGLLVESLTVGLVIGLNAFMIYI